MKTTEQLKESLAIHRKADDLVATSPCVAPTCFSCGHKIYPVNDIFAKRGECRSCFMEKDGPYETSEEE